MTLQLTEEMADVVMGAFAVCYSEGIHGIVGDIDKNACDAAYENLIGILYALHPNIVTKYDFIPSVDDVMRRKDAVK